jgi:hypothetical protein
VADCPSPFPSTYVSQFTILVSMIPLTLSGSRFSSLSPDENFILISNLSTGVDLYSLKDLNIAGSYNCVMKDESNVPISVGFLGGGQLIICGSHNGVVPIWHRNEGKLLQTLEYDGLSSRVYNSASTQYITQSN